MDALDALQLFAIIFFAVLAVNLVSWAIIDLVFSEEDDDA